MLACLIISATSDLYLSNMAFPLDRFTFSFLGDMFDTYWPP